MKYGEEFDSCDVGGGPLVRSLIHDVHDKASSRLEEVLTQMFKNCPRLLQLGNIAKIWIRIFEIGSWVRCARSSRLRQ